jgi:hypothetical protein
MSAVIETDLKEILVSIQGELKGIKDDLTDLKVSQAEVRGDIANVRTEQNLIREGVKDLKGRASAQMWTLIGLLGTVITVITGLQRRPTFAKAMLALLDLAKTDFLQTSQKIVLGIVAVVGFVEEPGKVLQHRRPIGAVFLLNGVKKNQDPAGF